ncbi:hypothetical protein DMJ13_20120 [halophilic archaeon]|nr:hypothetical protein DMJ13_20120 [halophilic archaeon]
MIGFAVRSLEKDVIRITPIDVNFGSTFIKSVYFVSICIHYILSRAIIFFFISNIRYFLCNLLQLLI